jgi:2-dehydro-3-deoxyglucarate aldolase
MKYLENNVKKKLRSNQVVIGSWLNLPSVEVAEIMAQTNFEYLVIDAEHGTSSLETIQKQVSAIHVYVRVQENNLVIIKRVLETGVSGIMVPMVNTKEQAQAVVKNIAYPPKGVRGAGLSRAQGYGTDFAQYKEWAQGNLSIVAQIEHIDAINNLEEILSVEEIDATIIGPYDLSASLGFPGEFDRSEVKEALSRYLEVCKKFNKPAGVHVISSRAREVQERINQGFKFIVFSIDMLFIKENINRGLKELEI